MVVFRTSADVGLQGYFRADAYIVPRWGFYGFVAATMLSLSGTHLVLYLHRKVEYPQQQLELAHQPQLDDADDGNDQVDEKEQEVDPNRGDHDAAACIDDDMDDEEEGRNHQLGSYEGTTDATVVGGGTAATAKKTPVNRRKSAAVVVARTLLLALNLALILVGSLVDVFVFTYERGGEGPPESSSISSESEPGGGQSQQQEQQQRYFSIVGVGQSLPYSSPYGSSSFGIRFIQMMYFILALAVPLWNSILLAFLLAVVVRGLNTAITTTTNSGSNRIRSNSRRVRQRRLRQYRNFFLLTEIAFAWSALEVLAVSCIFSVFQIPKFASKMVDNPACAEAGACFRVRAQLLPAFAWTAAAAAWNFGSTLWLFGTAHRSLFGGDG